MPRIIIVSDDDHVFVGHDPDAPVFLDEEVCLEDLSDGASADDLIQRLARALCDAADEGR